MLHLEAIDTQTLELLTRVLSIPEFSNLQLVGGTALALQIGHRKSIDIDLFGQVNFEQNLFINRLSEVGDTKLISQTENIKVCTVDGIKVDLVNYPYKWLNPPIVEKGIPLSSKEDIAAMKLSAITGRGTKKDFVDIYFLLESFSLRTMLDLYNQKYPDGSEFMVLKSLCYYEDAESDPEPNMLKEAHWDVVKTTILKITSELV